MTSIRRTLSSLSFVAFLLLGAAPAAANTVLIARVDAAGADTAVVERLNASLRIEARRVVGERLSSSSPERPQDCRDDQACAAALAASHSASLVVLTRYSESGGQHVLGLRLHDSGGKLLGKAERTLVATPDEHVVREALYSLLSPGEYVGRLRFEGAPPNALVSVDRLPLAAADLQQPYPVSVGTHLVEIAIPGQAPVERQVVVRFDEDVTVNAAAPAARGAMVTSGPSAAASTAVPWWPPTVTGGIAVAAGLAAIIWGTELAFTANTVAEQTSDLKIGEFQRQHRFTAWRIPTEIEQRQLVDLRATMRADAVIAATASAITLIAGAATAGLAARWALADDEEAP